MSRSFCYVGVDVEECLADGLKCVLIYEGTYEVSGNTLPQDGVYYSERQPRNRTPRPQNRTKNIAS